MSVIKAINQRFWSSAYHKQKDNSSVGKDFLPPLFTSAPGRLTLTLRSRLPFINPPPTPAVLGTLAHWPSTISWAKACQVLPQGDHSRGRERERGTGEKRYFYYVRHYYYKSKEDRWKQNELGGSGSRAVQGGKKIYNQRKRVVLFTADDTRDVTKWR